jgi:hypothetical protein
MAPTSGPQNPGAPGSEAEASEAPAPGPPAAPEGFWDGDFALHADEPAARRGAPAIHPLGPSGITVRGRDLAALLAPSYRRLTGTGGSAAAAPAADPAGD